MIRTTIPPETAKSSLLKGFFLALIGIIIIVGMGILFPVPELKLWGFPLFLFSLWFIAYGLIPYKKLTGLQSKPNILQLEHENVQFLIKNEKALDFPIDAIEKCEYRYIDRHTNGIAIWIKPENVDKLRYYTTRNYLNKNGVKFNIPDKANFLFQYFSERSARELLESLNQQDDDE